MSVIYFFMNSEEFATALFDELLQHGICLTRLNPLKWAESRLYGTD